MTLIQTDLNALRQAIRELSRMEREDLAEWILNSPDVELHVSEAALPYGGLRYLTVEEYLQLDDGGLTRYEYVAGRIFAMASPLVRHEMIAMNVAVQFQNQLSGTPCRAFSGNSAVRLKVDQDDIFYLPDVMIACGPFTEEVLNTRWLTNPCIVVEVLSSSTESIDRREKALNYRHISSLEEYVLIAQRSMEVTVFRRDDNWQPLVLTAPEDVFESRAVEVNLSLADIYSGVR